MAGSHADGDLIAAIYDAVIDPSRWDEVVKRIVDVTKSFSGNLVLQQADAGSLTALYNVDPVLADAYIKGEVNADFHLGWRGAAPKRGLAGVPGALGTEV